MVKYFLKGADEELQVGDKIVLDFNRETEGGKEFHHLDCEFYPELIPLLMENDIIEMREIKDEEDEEMKALDCEFIETMLKASESLNTKVNALQQELDILTTLIKSVGEMHAAE